MDFLHEVLGIDCRQPQSPKPAAMNEDVELLESLLKRRHSCRSFRLDEVPVQDMERILKLAQQTPSWCNVQPWDAVITSGAATQRLSALLVQMAGEGQGRYDIDPPVEYAGKYRQRRRAAGYKLYDTIGIAHDDLEGRRSQGMKNYQFFGAPHAAIITSEAPLGPYAYVDCGGYIANFLLAATSLGIATLVQASIASYAEEIREHLGIPESKHVICAIAFGYADESNLANSFRAERADLSEAIRWEN